MRIISSRRDYYDCIQAYGQDRSVIYVREESKPVNIPWPFPVLSTHGLRSVQDFSIVESVIGFCGKVYPMISFFKWTEPNTHFCYRFEELNGFLTTVLKGKDKKEYERPQKKGERSWWVSRNIPPRPHVEEYFKSFLRAQDNFHNLFQHNGKDCPIFIVERTDAGHNRGEIIYNPMLNYYEFYRVFDPFSAYQELRMWMGNLAEPRKKIPTVSNEDMIVAKGFDLKESFRKPPTKKRK